MKTCLPVSLYSLNGNQLCPLPQVSWECICFRWLGDFWSLVRDADSSEDDIQQWQTEVEIQILSQRDFFSGC